LTRKFLDAAIVLLLAALLLIVALGGIDYDWGPVRIRLHSASRPLLLLGLLLAVRVWASGLSAFHLATRSLLAVIAATAAIYATYQVRVCGGLDSYGYVSTSALIASGRLTQPQPLVRYLPFDGASNAVAPLGYVGGRDGRSEVPRFPLGLPVVMALFRVFGASGPFYVPLTMAYATMLLAFLLARDSWREHEAGRPVTLLVGLFAAAIVAVDPLMVDFGIQPMSDVPAACWVLAALWLRLSPGGRSPLAGNVREHGTRSLLAGLCAGMALLTRPALLPAVIAIGVVALDRPLKESIRYATALLAFVVLQMGLNHVLYGDARTSGYGPASYMFEVSSARLAANAANFGKWLTDSHTVLIWLLWPVSLVILRKQDWAWRVSFVAVAAAAPYLFYLVFDDWESSRFLLPTVLIVLILSARAAGDTIARLASTPAVQAVAVTLLAATAFVCAVASHRYLQSENVYRLGDLEAKYALAGAWIDAHTPERAVVFAGLHSGSVRYYGHRQTIRWDQIPPDKMGATLHNLRAAGFDPYLVLDTPTEPPLFDARFRLDQAVRIDPIGRIRVVNFYRFVSGP
jgi:hypothetical protein